MGGAKVSYIKGFEHYLKSKDKSDNTICCYIRDVKEFISWYSSKTDCSIAKVIELDAVEYKKHLQKSNIAIITLNRKVAGVNSFLKWMRDAGHIGQEISIKPIKNKGYISQSN